MPINPQIVVPQVQGIQLENPLALARNAMAIQEARSTIAANQLKSNRAALATSIFKQNAGKPPEQIANALFAAGLPDEAENVMKYQTAGGQSAKARREAEAAGLQLLGSEAGAFANDPASLNKAAIMPWATAAVQRGLLSSDALARFEAMPDDPRALSAAMRRLQVQALTPQQQLATKVQEQDLGGQSRFVRIPELGGPGEVVEGLTAPITRSPNAPVTNINMPSKKFGETIGEKAAERLDAYRENAEQAARGVDTNARLRPLLNDKNFISGTFADARLAVARAAGIDVSATEGFLSGMAEQVAARIKAFGTGTGLSNADRDYALAWAGGKPDLSTKGIARIMRINDQSADEVMKKYNKEREFLSKAEPQILNYYPAVGARGVEVGTVKQGYRFMGGDPANQANWEKVK